METGQESVDSSEFHKLDLSGQCLKKILPQHYRDSHKITSLHLDNNELQKLELIEKFSSLVELSASHNQIIRMYPVSNLQHLVRLDLSYNSIILIEGLKGLIHLKYLNLSSNKIKNLEKLQNNVLLEHLDLSENNIAGLSNISELRNLKKLFLHKNMISQLRHAELYLPKDLVTLTLAGNRIIDITEVSRLVNLPKLSELSFVSNPCVEQFSGNSIAFDYRPYLINWCLDLKVIDGFVVDDIERLKAEWLYSQGRGRKFKPGQHAELVKYLMETCPINSRSLMTENERKLRLILSKAHQHQKQLKMTEQPGDKGANSELMTRSLDNSLLESCTPRQEYYASPKMSSQVSLTRSLCDSSCFRPTPSEESISSYKSCISRSPLPAATKLVPVPESLVSPLVANPPPMPTSSNDMTPDHVSDDKLQNIKQLAQIKREKSDSQNRELAALCIQKYWRGYLTRKLHPIVLSMQQHLQVRRTHQHIHKLSLDIESIRVALDSEHKLQLLQMQATKALWKKVQDLQNCMQELLRCVSPNSSATISTQTDVTALHSPTQGNEKVQFS